MDNTVQAPNHLGEFYDVVCLLIPELAFTKEDDPILNRLKSRFMHSGNFAGPDSMPPGSGSRTSWSAGRRPSRR